VNEYGCCFVVGQGELGGQTRGLSWKQELPPHLSRSTKLDVHSEQEEHEQKVRDHSDLISSFSKVVKKASWQIEVPGVFVFLSWMNFFKGRTEKEFEFQTSIVKCDVQSGASQITGDPT